MKRWQWSAIGLGTVGVGAAALIVHRNGSGSALANGYALQASLSAPSATINTQNIQQSAITIQWTTSQGGQPLAGQTITVTIQRASGPTTTTVTTNAQGQAQTQLYTAHAQTMVVTGTWTDPTGQQHVATVQPSWTGGTSSSASAPLQVSYSLRLDVNPTTLTAGQSVTIGVETLKNVTQNGQMNSPQTGNFPVGGQTVQITGAAHGTITTGSSGRGTSTFTPQGVGSGAVTATWTDPNGGSHTHSVTITVASAAPKCPPQFVVDIAEATSLSDAQQKAPWFFSQRFYPSNPSAIKGCPFVVAAVTVNQGNLAHYVVGVVGSTKAALLNYLGSLGWNVTATTMLGQGTLAADGSATLSQLQPYTGG